MKPEFISALRDSTYQTHDEMIRKFRDKRSDKLEFLEDNNIVYLTTGKVEHWRLFLSETKIKEH